MKHFYQGWLKRPFFKIEVMKKGETVKKSETAWLKL